MRKFIALSACLGAFILPSTLSASQSLVKEVEEFYMNFETSMTSGNYETTIDLLERYIADDFGHYDDGEFTYGKEEFKGMLSTNSEQKIGTDMSIDMKSVKFSEEKNEILANFIIKQEIYTNKEKDGKTEPYLTASVKLECNDYLRILDPETVKLYKCDCTTLEKFDSREHKNKE